MDNNDVIPVNQLPEDDVIPINALPETNSENFLQKAIKTAGLFVPSNSQELGDVGRMAFRQLTMARGGSVNPMTMGPFGAGLNIAGVDKIGGVPLQTEWGKVMEGQVVDPALLASGGAIGLKRGVQGIAGLMDVDAAKRAMSGAVRKGAESAESAIGKMSQSANEEMGRGLGNIQNTGLTPTQLDDVLTKTAFEIDPTGTTHNVPGSMANEVLKLKSGIHGNPSTMSGSELQARFVALKDALGKVGSKSQGAFNKIFKDILPDSFRSVKDARSAVYATEEAARPLTKSGTLNKIAKGTADDELVSQLRDAEKKVPGLDIIGGIEKSGKNLRRANTLRNVSMGALKASPYLAGLGWLISKISGNR